MFLAMIGTSPRLVSGMKVSPVNVVCVAGSSTMSKQPCWPPPLVVSTDDMLAAANLRIVYVSHETVLLLASER